MNFMTETLPMVNSPSTYKTNLMNILRSTTKEEMDLYKQTFQLFDKDGDGLIDSKELTSVLKVLDMQVTERDIKELIADVDVGHTGSISLEGFVYLIKSPLEEEGTIASFIDSHQSKYAPRKLSLSVKSSPFENEHGRARRKSIASPSQSTDASKKFGNSLFGALGLKKNNRTSVVSESKSNTPLSPSSPSTPSRRSTIGSSSTSPTKARTRNHQGNPVQQNSVKPNGKAGFNFLSLFNKGKGKSPTISSITTERIVVGTDADDRLEGDELSEESDMKQVFKIFDMDGDGLVSVDEVLNVMQKLGLGIVMGDEEISTLFSLVDSDGDGRISYSEFCTLFSMPA